MDAMTREEKPLLVSRKGFTQWYAPKDMAEIFNITEGLGKRVALEKAAVALRNGNRLPEESPVQMPSVAAPIPSTLKNKAASAAPSARVLKKQVAPKPQMSALG